MRIGDLVRPLPEHFSVSEEHWVGVVIDFHTHVDRYGEPQARYAVVCWNADFPQEEEDMDSLEVVNEGR